MQPQPFSFLFPLPPQHIPHSFPLFLFSFPLPLFWRLLKKTVGPIVKGLPIPSMNNQKLDYRCNGLSSWYLTLAVSVALHVTGIFPLSSIIDHFGEVSFLLTLW